jgi:dephospho-CoA kinase
MLVVGLTGSIASGKSEVTKLLSKAGTPIFDSDAEVHKLYARPDVAATIAKQFPASLKGEAIDRAMLGKIVLAKPEELKKLENLVHPEVRKEREKFIYSWAHKGVPFVVVDIPLLFETGEDSKLDITVVVSAEESIRKARALQRPGMNEEKFAVITARQMPDAEKNRRAYIILKNSGTLEQLHRQVDNLIIRLKEIARDHMP